MPRRLRRNVRPTLFARTVAALHYRLYRRALAHMREGGALSRAQLRLGRALQRVYARCESMSSGERQVLMAGALRHTLNHVPIAIYPGELIVGNCSSKRIGAPIHPDFGGLMMQPELADLPRRGTNPIQLDADDWRALEDDIFPYWFNRSVLARYPLYTDNLELANQALNGSFFVVTQFAGISHLTPDYPAVVREGVRGLRRRIDVARATLNAADAERGRFLDAAEIALDGLVDYATRWRAHLTHLAARSAQ